MQAVLGWPFWNLDFFAYLWWFFLLVLFYSNMFGRDNVVCWGQNGLVCRLKRRSLCLVVFLGFLGNSRFMFFAFIQWILSCVLVLEFVLIEFWFLQIRISLLVNNIGLSGINNMFCFMDCNLRVSILHWNPFMSKLWLLSDNRDKLTLYS
jgi:hypothetical protein